ncbi:MAG TPA: LLM class flavin-dependent oxidoreductase [Candidatus Binatia bacterium]|nr:LLM class flavin-dependent oxidoreductase [Candidatus Binatia bacterium]
MEFGITLFPDVSPEEKAAADYFRESFAIVERAEELGYTLVRSIEHHFTPYGGYSPSSILMLTALAARTKKMKLVTGAVIPAFNHPLKIAGELGMLDAISNGRLMVGFGRAFLLHEFRRFGVSRDESQARFREGIEQVALLLTTENATSHGKFHSFENTTTLPRPTQRPRPQFFIAANTTAASYEFAGRQGHYIMGVPMVAEKLRANLDLYRKAWAEAGHPGRGKVFLAFHMFVDRDSERARRIAGKHVESYFKSLVEATVGMDTERSSDYEGYEKQRQQIAKLNIDTLIASCAAWVGSPAEVREQIARYHELIGGFDYAALQVNFHTLPFEEAMRSIELFAHEVMPEFSEVPALT